MAFLPMGWIKVFLRRGPEPAGISAQGGDVGLFDEDIACGRLFH
jgi:hypothetical protein